MQPRVRESAASRHLGRHCMGLILFGTPLFRTRVWPRSVNATTHQNGALPEAPVDGSAHLAECQRAMSASITLWLLSDVQHTAKDNRSCQVCFRCSCCLLMSLAGHYLVLNRLFSTPVLNKHPLFSTGALSLDCFKNKRLTFVIGWKRTGL